MNARLTPLRASDFKRTPWKNGLGWTDQIAIHPPTADLRRGDFTWRIASAHVAQSAPFSIFAEHDRVLVILEGAGVRLSHEFEPGEAPEVTELPPLEPYEFPGDVATRCDLIDGPVRDLSVFLRKGHAQVTADVIDLTSDEPFYWEPQARTALIYVVEGEVAIEGTRVPASDALRVDFQAGPPDAPVELNSSSGAPARAVLIQIEYA